MPYGTLTDFIAEEAPPIQCTHTVYFQSAFQLSEQKTNSVHLVITSPPYWNIKNYGNNLQIGFNDTYDQYIANLLRVFHECSRVLCPKGNLCINVGNQFIKTEDSPKKMFEIMPIYEDLVSKIRETCPSLTYIGTILWKKVSNHNTSGKGSVVGSYPYPASGLFFINYEYILVFRKEGERPEVDPALKLLSQMTRDEWMEYFQDTWEFAGSRQDVHIAMFPDELPRRLIKMFSFVGDTVLDPFLGSGTTARIASRLGRNSIGYEIGFGKDDGVDFKHIIREKVEVPKDVLKYVEGRKKDQLYKFRAIHNKYVYFDS